MPQVVRALSMKTRYCLGSIIRRGNRVELKSLLLAVSFVGTLSIQTSAQEINMYDQNKNYRYGNVSPGGQINMYDQNGNYSYGQINPQ
jgi:hypothetical protein